MRQSDNYILSHLRRFFLQKCDTRLLLTLVSLVLCNSVYAQQITPNVSSGTKFEEAVHYENAEGVTRDYAKALALYCASAKNGNVNALYAMGWMYANGRGVIRDDQIAGLLFSLAAAKGHVHAGELLQYFPVNGTAGTPVCLQPDPVEPNEVDPSSGPATVFPTGRISKLVAKLAPLYQIDPQLAMAVISV
ncbi:MAG: tetratricopeptide repeat protein, partial [Herbaspirillum sp.]